MSSLPPFFNAKRRFTIFRQPIYTLYRFHNSTCVSPTEVSVRKNPGYGRLVASMFTIMSTTSSSSSVGSVTVRERVNSGLKGLSGAKPCFFSGKVASVVAEVGSLFLRFRALICKSRRQKAHGTVARVRFALENVKNCHHRSTFGR